MTNSEAIIVLRTFDGLYSLACLKNKNVSDDTQKLVDKYHEAIDIACAALDNSIELEDEDCE